MKIEDAVVLVTGSSRGLGRALVRAALEAGAARVYAAARRSADVADLAAASPDRVVPVALDVTDAASIAAAAARATDVTLLVNNAGTLAAGGVLTTSSDGVASDFAVNVFGTLATSKAFLPALERAGAAGGAAIVNVLSVVSLANMPGLGAYSASKAAAFSFTQALRADLAKKKIAVHAALPGAIDTDMAKDLAIPKASPDAVARGILQGVVLGHDEILPDPMSRDLFALWAKSPKELERQLAAMSGG